MGALKRVLQGGSRWLLPLTSLLFASACGSNSSGPFSAKAQQIVGDIASSNFAAVRTDFDPTMQASLSEPVLQNNWRTFQEQFGIYKGYGTPVSVIQGQIDVERVPVTMGSNTEEIRVAFHPDGTIAGLFFLSSNAPAP